MNGWPHDNLSTCVPECALFGLCHCGCGQKTKPSTSAWAKIGRVKGMPHLFLNGHIRHLKPSTVGSWGKTGVPAERVRPLLTFLRNHYGSIASAARMLDCPPGMVGYWFHAKRVSPKMAERIAAAVLALQPAERDHHPRPANSWESERAEHYRRFDIGHRDGPVCACGAKKRSQAKMCDSCRRTCKCGQPKTRFAETCLECYRKLVIVPKATCPLCEGPMDMGSDRCFTCFKADPKRKRFVAGLEVKRVRVSA